MRKLLVAKILALALILNPVSALAQDITKTSIVNAAETGTAPSISQSMTPDQLKQVVDDVAYSIENIEEALIDIQKLAGGPDGNQKTPAAGGMSKSVIVKLSERFGAAIELLSALQVDTKLDDKLRDAYVDKVNGRVGALFFKVLRFHGEDEIKLEKGFKASPEYREGMGKVKEALARTLYYMKKVFKEFALDVKTLVTFKRAAIDAQIGGKKVPMIVWGPVDRVRRNQLMGQIIPHLNTYASEILPKVKSEADRLGAGRDFWVEKVITPSIEIRKERVWGQKAATATYMGLAVVGFFAPFIDIVAIGNGFERTDLTLDYSAQLYFGTWLTFGLMKGATFMAKGTKTTITALEGVLDMFKKVPGPGSGKAAPAPLPDRLLNLSKDIQHDRKLAASRVKACFDLF